MLKIDVNELKENISKYIDSCASQDIEITVDDKVVAVLSSPDASYYQSLFNLCGSLENGDTNEDYKDMIGEEILKKYGF